jgi:hypothetical protein
MAVSTSSVFTQQPADESQGSNDKQMRAGYGEMEPADVVCCPLPDIKAVATSRLKYSAHLSLSARAPLSLGEARDLGQKIHFTSPLLYMETRCSARWALHTSMAP